MTPTHPNPLYAPAIAGFGPFDGLHEELPHKRTPQAGGGQRAVECGGLGGPTPWQPSHIAALSRANTLKRESPAQRRGIGHTLADG